MAEIALISTGLIPGSLLLMNFIFSTLSMKKELLSIPDIRNLFMPIQPTVTSSGRVNYREYAPADPLQSVIYCYWELKTDQPLHEPFVYRVVADGCIDIFFEPGIPKEHFIMGFCRKYTEFELPASFRYVGIRFLPAMFPQFFGIDASQLSNRHEHLDVVVPEIANFLLRHIQPGTAMAEICRLLDRYLLERFSSVSVNPDSRFYDAMDIILRKQGMIQVERDLGTGISQRQLRRLFQYYVGDSPKVFSGVVRFQHILRAKPSTQSLRQNKLFFDAGYYDQAHFIKAFRNFYGVSPTRAFGRE